MKSTYLIKKVVITQNIVTVTSSHFGHPICLFFNRNMHLPFTGKMPSPRRE